MALASTLQQYLADKGARYDVVQHEPAFSASRAAQASHVTGKAMAKAVVLKDAQGFLLAVLPTSRRIRFDALADLLHRKLELASEEEAAALFADCEVGAVPALGDAYHVPVVMDESLTTQPEIYFEGGDHSCLLHMSEAQFEGLMANAVRGRFSA